MRRENAMDIGRIQGNPQSPVPPVPAAREAALEAADQLDEIRQYFKDLYARREVVARTTTASGQQLDWVPAESQQGKAVAEPPDLGPAERSVAADRPSQASGFELADPRNETGPPGTVPIARKSLDLLMPTGTLQDYLAKGPRAKRVTPPDDPAPALHAGRIH
jgi:hypothetical protein